MTDNYDRIMFALLAATIIGWLAIMALIVVLAP